MIFRAVAVATLALAAWSDGDTFRAGFCAGAAFILVLAALQEWEDEHNASEC